MKELPEFEIRWRKFLYHYTTAKTASEYILPTGTLRFGSLQNTNDPREFLDWTIGIQRITNKANWTTSSYGDVNKLQKPVNQLCRKNAKLACFTMNYLLNSEPEHSIRGFERPRMWAQYADRFSGVCLCFNREHLLNRFQLKGKTNENIDAHEIDYIPFNASMEDCIYIADHPSLSTNGKEFKNYLIEHIWERRKNIYFEKLSDWSGEAEFRIAAITDSEEPDYIKYENSLVAIVLGPEIPVIDAKSIIAQANEIGINVHMLVWDTGAPKLIHLAGDKEFVNENNPCSHYLFY